MNEASSANTGSPASDLDRQMDERCGRFETEWRERRQPRIEDFLADWPPSARSVLLRKLVQLDVAFRCRTNETIVPRDYVARFPEAAPWISLVIEQAGDFSIDTPSPQGDRSDPGPPVTIVTEVPQLDGYEIYPPALEPGGWGIVYKARKLTLNRLVALKFIKSGPLADEEELTRFRIEAQAAARLDHPNLVRIYDFGQTNGRPYIAMEFVEGGSLARKLLGQPLAPRDAARLAEILAQAMNHVHRQQIVHRDLKPGNVLLGAELGESSQALFRPSSPSPLGSCVPKIADFGLAKFLDRDLRLTPSKRVLGTPYYMAPEQATGKVRDVGRAADVYALGAVLYELLTGQPPFLGETYDAILKAVIEDDPLSPSSLQPAIPPDLETICLKCLEKDLKDRLASMAELAQELRHFLDGESLTVTPITEWERQARWARAAGYELIELVGASALGLMYKARQTALGGRLVVLKTIASPAQADPPRLARFQAEAAASARLQHPNIVQIYEFGEVKGQVYFSQEFLMGGNLAERDPDAPISVRQVVTLLETLARAVHHAHRRGVIHGDLRPFNVLLTVAGSSSAIPKITGFGVRTLLLQDGSGDEFAVPLGLSSYMAPEQADGRSEAIGPATDVHALGAILYELLAGRAPFLADTVQETLDQIRFTEPPLPSHWQPSVPRVLDMICQRCLQKDPDRRFPSAEELAEELHRFLRGDETDTDEFEVIPGFELREQLGQGGLGVVHKAVQKSLDRPVALKLFRADLPRESLQRIIAANRARARLKHPNILPVIDSGERDGVVYVAEELAEGGTLDDRIDGQPQPPRQAALLVETVARAIHYAHRQGIIHRNLKLRAVLLTADGVPKIGSFELAKLQTVPAPAADDEGLTMGTPIYMAPEQIRGGEEAIQPATDVYALGNILYQLLTGQPPFQGESLQELIEKVRSQPALPPSRWQPSVPRALDVICLRCLQKLPEHRYPDAEALANSLHEFLVGRPSAWRRIAGWLFQSGS